MSNAFAATLDHVITTIRTGITSLEACAASPAGADTILAWDNGLAVKMVGDEPRAVSIDAADAFMPRQFGFKYPVAMNGNRETARAMTRAEAARAYLPTLRDALADFETR